MLGTIFIGSDKVIDRITKNEEKLDKLVNAVKNMNKALSDFENCQKDLKLLSKYYGSKNWFKDKEAYENGDIEKIKAGVLSEDAVWNMLIDIDEIILDMKRIISNYARVK